MGTGSFLGVKSGRGVTLTPHPLLVPLSLKSRAIPLFPLCVVRPVQSLSACTLVHFTFDLFHYKCQQVNAVPVIKFLGLTRNTRMNRVSKMLSSPRVPAGGKYNSHLLLLTL
jgi:hypothetical protein